jgi:DnaJ-class molecular chaperone
MIKVINNTKYTRSGMDLVLKIKLSLKEALCGFSLEKHINGTININNMNKEAVAKPGTRQIIKDMGIRKNNVTGNLCIEITEIVYPDKITLENKETISRILEVE